MKLDLGKDFEFKLENLIDTRLLIQANSGGGKSWAIRKLLEVTHGKVHQIVLDIEGDFPSMREKFDYILAGKGGDIPANPKTAELLARKILELKTDIIIDLYELKQYERIKFVRLFLDAMINAPKDLWHPCLVIVDEAHIFAPEKGQAESMGSVIDLCTRGRKRGYCGVLATQRLSKLHKDAAAECNNKLIGRTGLDIDLKRAGDELGFTSQKDARTLRNLEPGQFYAFGPAFEKGVHLKTIGSVITSHPKAGSRTLGHTPAPTAKVKSILQKLTDIPKEAEQDLQDKESMKARIRELERSLKFTSNVSIATEEVLQKSYNQGFSVCEKQSIDREKTLKKSHDSILFGLKDKITQIIYEIDKLIVSSSGIKREGIGSYSLPIRSDKPPKVSVKFIEGPPIEFKNDKKYPKAETQKTDFRLGRCERKILGFLHMKSGQSFTLTQVGAMTGYSSGSGGFNNAISKLFQMDAISRRNGEVEINPAFNAASIIGNETPHRLEDWISKLGACERKIYERLLDNPQIAWDKQGLGSATGYSYSSGGFNNALSRLNTLGLIQRRGQAIQLNQEIINL